MSHNKVFGTILATLLILSIIPNVLAQNESKTSLKIWTDKRSYTTGEITLITAQVKPVSNEYVYISIIGPDGKIFFNDKFLPDEKGFVQVKFGISIGYPLGRWTVVGTYMGVNAKVMFRWTGSWYAVFTLDRQEYTAGDTVFMKGTVFPPSKETVIVLDPDRNAYLQKDLQTESDGSISFSFQLAKDASPGKWSIEVITGDFIKELSFDLSNANVTKWDGVATIKELHGIMFISIKNTGKEAIRSLLIHVSTGSIAFVKAENWAKIRATQNEVTLISSKALKHNQSMIMLLKWKDKPQIPKDMKIQLVPTPLKPDGSLSDQVKPVGTIDLFIDTS